MKASGAVEAGAGAEGALWGALLGAGKVARGGQWVALLARPASLAWRAGGMDSVHCPVIKVPEISVTFRIVIAHHMPCICEL